MTGSHSGHDTSATADSSVRATLQHWKENGEGLVERILVPFLGILVLGLGAAGIWLHESARPKGLPTSPQQVEVYVGDTRARIDLTEEVGYGNDVYDCMYLKLPKLSESIDTMVVVTTNVRADAHPNSSTDSECAEPGTGQGLKEVDAPVDGQLFNTTAGFITTLSSIRRVQRENSMGLLIGGFQIPKAVIATDKDFDAHLPWLAAAEVQTAPSVYLSEVDPSAANPKMPLFVPHHLSTTAILKGAQLDFAETNEYHIDNNTPTNGHFSGRDFEWQGSLSLDPSLTATTPNATETQSSDDLFAGIFIATAAAAGIALAQELAARARRRRDPGA